MSTVNSQSSLTKGVSALVTALSIFTSGAQAGELSHSHLRGLVAPRSFRINRDKEFSGGYQKHFYKVDLPFDEVVTHLLYLSRGNGTISKERENFTKMIMEDDKTKILEIRVDPPSQKLLEENGLVKSYRAGSGQLDIRKIVDLPGRSVPIEFTVDQEVIITYSGPMEVQSIRFKTYLTEAVNVVPRFSVGPYSTSLEFSRTETGNTEVSLEGSIDITTHKPLFRKKVAGNGIGIFHFSCENALRNAKDYVDTAMRNDAPKLRGLSNLLRIVKPRKFSFSPTIPPVAAPNQAHPIERFETTLAEP